MRRLIINADDLELTEGVNRAVEECHRAGTVTSTTVMAGGAAFDDAVSRLRANPTLRAGCHVVLIDGVPMSPHEKIATLMNGGQLNFRTSLVNIAYDAFFGFIDEDEVALEATAQINKLKSAGVTLSHVDTHKHTHVFPSVARGVLRAASECGVNAVRNPFVPLGTALTPSVLLRPAFWIRTLQLSVLRSLYNGFRRTVRELGMVTTDGTLGTAATGVLNADILAEIITEMPEGTWELVCHPGYNDAALSGIRTRLRQSRETERQVLTSPETRQLLEKHGVELIDFTNLQ